LANCVTTVRRQTTTGKVVVLAASRHARMARKRMRLASNMAYRCSIAFVIPLPLSTRVSVYSLAATGSESCHFLCGPCLSQRLTTKAT
jgi:hypothetical protein